MFYQTDSWHDVECLLFAVISVHSGKCLAICHPVVEAALASVLSQLVSKLLAITLPDQSSTSLEIHFFSILLLIAPRKKTGHRGQSQISRVPKGRESGLEICISICGCLNCNQIENQSSKVMKVVLFQDTRTWCSESPSSVLVWQKLPLMGTFQFLLCTPRWKLPFVNCCYTWLEVGDVHR